jgi:hypothetical protein
LSSRLQIGVKEADHEEGLWVIKPVQVAEYTFTTLDFPGADQTQVEAI